jgi:hypothetical protein
MNTFWTRVKSENIDKIIPWREANLGGVHERETAFYPLSGADLINLFTMYPNSREYLMVALEEPGIVPDPLKMSEWDICLGLISIRNVIWTLASQNYFISSIMKKEMPNKYLTGVGPVILVLAARMNLFINNFEEVQIDARGTLSPVDPNGIKNDEKPVIAGCRITFTSPGSYFKRKITYLQIRLSSDTFRGTGPESIFFKKYPRFNTIMKSAVFLLHSPNFKDLADDILKRSVVMVQDDSGIPYRYFNKDEWGITHYGNYAYPYPLTDLKIYPYQPDLAADMAANSKPLPFNYGYGRSIGLNKSNLMVGTKKK